MQNTRGLSAHLAMSCGSLPRLTPTLSTIACVLAPNVLIRRSNRCKFARLPRRARTGLDALGAFSSKGLGHIASANTTLVAQQSADMAAQRGTLAYVIAAALKTAPKAVAVAPKGKDSPRANSAGHCQQLDKLALRAVGSSARSRVACALRRSKAAQPPARRPARPTPPPSRRCGGT